MYLMDLSFALTDNTEYIVYLQSNSLDNTVLKITHSKDCMAKNEKKVVGLRLTDEEIDGLIEMLQMSKKFHENRKKDNDNK